MEALVYGRSVSFFLEVEEEEKWECVYEERSERNSPGVFWKINGQGQVDRPKNCMDRVRTVPFLGFLWCSSFSLEFSSCYTLYLKKKSVEALVYRQSCFSPL